MDSNISKENLICWVDHFNFFSWLKLIWLRKKYDIDQVYYFSGSSIALKWARKTWAESVCLEEIHLEIREVLLKKIMQQIKDVSLADGKESFRNLFPLVMRGLGSVDREKLEFYLTQQLAIELRTPLVIIHNLIVNGASMGGGNKEGGVLVLLQDHYFMRYLKEFYKETVAHIEVYPCLKEIFQNIYYPFKVSLEILFNAFLLAVGKGKKDSFDGNRAKVAVLHTHGADLERKCDYFWLPDSGMKKEDVILYFKHVNRGPTEDVLKIVEDLEIPWVNLLPFRLGLGAHGKWGLEVNIFPSKFYVSRLIRLLWVYCKSQGIALWKRQGLLFWFCTRTIHVLDDMYFFETFFRRNNIKVHYGAYEAGRHMMAANMAIQTVGGIDLCHHWSNYDKVDIDIGKPQDVYFTWGPYYYDHFFNQDFYRVKNFVYAGYPYDYALQKSRLAAQEYRKQLEEKGASFVISFFDQTIFPVYTNWNNEQEKLYVFFLEYLVNHLEVGLILKPKKVKNLDILRKRSDKIASLLDAAKETGRLKVLEAKQFPFEAAFASDLAVGVGVSSTPCIEAALAGIPAVTYNAENDEEYPLYAQGLGKIVFSDFKAMVETIEQFIEKREPADLGDFSFIIDEIDPFRDGKAGRRVGSYINNVLQGFKENKSKDQAMASADLIFRREHGENKISNGQFVWNQN